MTKHKDDDTSFIQKDYFYLPQCPNFLESSFPLHLTKRAQDLFERGSRGQGYVGVVHLGTGNIDLVPAFNKNDGLLRIDKNKMPFDIFVNSDGALGQLSGDLHLKASQLLGFSGSNDASNNTSQEKPARMGKLLGFAIWKAGFAIKFLNSLPSNFGLVSNEYIVVKQNDNAIDKFVLYYIDRERVINFINMNELDLNPYLSDCQTVEEIGIKELEKIEPIIESYHKKYYQDEDLGIKWIKNRSTSLNVFAIRYELPEYRHWFFARVSGHGSHLNDLIRELPLPVFSKILSAVTTGLQIAPIPMSKREDFDNSWFPGEVDGIRGHLQNELEWIQNKPKALLECGFVRSNKNWILKALLNGANLANSFWLLVSFASEDPNRKYIVSQLVFFAQCNDLESDFLLQVFKKILEKTIDDDCKTIFINAMAQLQSATNLNATLVKTLKDKNSELALALLKSGASPNASVLGESAFDLALTNKLTKVVNTMLKMSLFPMVLGNGLTYLTCYKETYNEQLIKRLLNHFNRVYFVNTGFKPDKYNQFNQSLVDAHQKAIVASGLDSPEDHFDVLYSNTLSRCKYPIALGSVAEADCIFQRLFMESVALGFQFLHLLPIELKSRCLNRLLINPDYLKKWCALESDKLKNFNHSNDTIVINTRELWKNLYAIYSASFNQPNLVLIAAINIIGCTNDLLSNNGIHVESRGGPYHIIMKRKITLTRFQELAQIYVEDPDCQIALAGASMLNLAIALENDHMIAEIAALPIASLFQKFGIAMYKNEPPPPCGLGYEPTNLTSTIGFKPL